MRRFTQFLPIAALGALALLAGCRDDRATPSAPAPDGLYLTVVGDDYTAGQPVHGAIFTTMPDGSIVNENVHYPSKLDVYLDGGPPPNAPMTAAGLPDGLFVFQITDPSGKYLLSQDPARCRVVEVQGGVIVKLLLPTEIPAYGSYGYATPTSDYWSDATNGPTAKYNDEACQLDGQASGRHDTNTDVDHGPPAIVVQMMPYLDTPNNGGVYKAWMTPLLVYLQKDGDPDEIPPQNGLVKVKGQPQGYPADPGFGPPRNLLKTDNFKAKLGAPAEPVLTVQKFHDANMNGAWDSGEEEITGWPVNYTTPDPLDPANQLLYTPATLIAADPVLFGTWSFTEQQPTGVQTVGLLDGVQQSLYPTASPTITVDVSGSPGENPTIVYGDVGVGSIEACKVYDNAGETPIAGWQIILTRTKDAAGNTLAAPLQTRTQTTGATGCTTFYGFGSETSASLLPGTYTLEELMADGYSAVGSTSVTVVLMSELSYNASSEPVLQANAYVAGSPVDDVTFTNRCYGDAYFGTKGYWHNKNGLDEVTTDLTNVLAYVHTLAPYQAHAGDTFGDGDVPFDGYYNLANLQPDLSHPADAAFNDDGDPLWGMGTIQAEISNFLVDSNGDGGSAEQLSQQLLAFIFNSWFRLGGMAAVIQISPTQSVVAGDLVQEAVRVWSGASLPGDRTVNELVTLLTWLNEHETTPLTFVSPVPCPVTYTVP